MLVYRAAADGVAGLAHARGRSPRARGDGARGRSPGPRHDGGPLHARGDGRAHPPGDLLGLRESGPGRGRRPVRGLGRPARNRCARAHDRSAVRTRHGRTERSRADLLPRGRLFGLPQQRSDRGHADPGRDRLGPPARALGQPLPDSAELRIDPGQCRHHHRHQHQPHRGCAGARRRHGAPGLLRDRQRGNSDRHRGTDLSGLHRSPFASRQAGTDRGAGRTPARIHRVHARQFRLPADRSNRRRSRHATAARPVPGRGGPR